MENCTNCKHSLKEEDLFCSNCGTKVNKPQLECPNCHTDNATTDSFCNQCGYELSLMIPNATASKRLNTNDPEEMSKELLGQFMRSLRRRIVIDHQSLQLDAYLNAFYKTNFNKQFISSVKQMAEETAEKNQDIFTPIDTQSEIFINQKIEELVDFFIIHHCKTINEINLPEPILKYQNTSLMKIDLPAMIADFFDWENEDEKVYTDFLKMPINKLKAASEHFLFPPGKEKIWMICDQSALGSCKEGFAITQNGLYWRAHFQDPRVVLFEQLKSVEKQQDWILINNQFFNVSPSVNLKMLYFMRKIKAFYLQK